MPNSAPGRRASRRGWIAHLAAGGPAAPAVITLLALHSQNAGKLARLLRYQQSCAKTAADERAGALNQALDELASELGWNV